MGFLLKSHKQEVLAAFKENVQRGLEAIGEQAITYSKKDTPVDTGRLKNSEEYRVLEDTVYIGTNVEYAIYQEYRKHFLKNAAANHTGKYKSIMRASLES